MSSSSWQAPREPLSLMPPQPRAPAWLPVLASETSPLTMNEPWGPRCGGGKGRFGVSWNPYPAPFSHPKPRLAPAPSDTVESFPPGGTHKFLCFSPNEKFALFMLLKAKGTLGSCVTHFTADFTFSLRCGASHWNTNGGRTVCSNLRRRPRARSLLPEVLGAGSWAGADGLLARKSSSR